MNDIDVFIFGDSITYGVGLEKDKQRDYNVFNLGISGDVTEGVKNRFDFEFNTRKDEENDKIIIFAIGVNDTQDINGNYRVTLEQFKDNILYLISNARKYVDNIVFIGLSKVDETKVVPLSWNKEKSYFNKKVIEFDNKLEEICGENNVRYLKMYDLLSVNDLSDGIHPNSIGHQKICDKVLDFLKI